MNLILTHEQADFDAIASLLGAHILYDDHTPVLPQRVNRNVHDFLDAYENSFPFHRSNQLPNEPVKSVTLVDTQSLVTLKGINNSTEIHAIDHHEKRKDISEEWKVVTAPIGAITTYFVEKIRQKKNVELSPLDATLLLLGIYEDTGLLTYTNTTARDAYAAAYLISKNANLEIASKFLNPPLSKAQRIVYQALLENMVYLEINGLNIIVSSAHAPHLHDEVSSIAHKLNALFEPDALFVFIAIDEGIRLVARSSSNRVDTARISKKFGGGGHPRASAALISYDDIDISKLDAIKTDLEAILSDEILPAIRVRNIMSKKPLTLKPDTTVEEAHSLMQRYGYEGFPVIQNGNIIGLLNRRAVDKAHANHLTKTASSLMEAGQFFVKRDDTLEQLQKVMAASGWGQIPVVSTKDDNVIGIVTRTDLLKAITGDFFNGKHRNMAAAIKQNTSEEEYQIIKLVSTAASELNMPIYIVGGFVRDLILEKPSPDFDIVVEGDAIELSNILKEKYGGKVTSHKKFGTAKWQPYHNKSLQQDQTLPISDKYLSTIPSLDLISARTEFYEKPTALPTIKQSSIKLDLHRRDFTINTMAIRLDGKYFGDIYDYWGGYDDLKQGLVRVLHSLSFVDDPTRMLRAIRFEKRFDFEIEPRTLDLLIEAVYLIDDVSGDRVRHELDQIFIEKNASDMMERLDQLNILSQIHPALTWDHQHKAELRLVKKDFPKIEKKDLILATNIILTCSLSPTNLNEVIKRLRFRSAIQQTLRSANLLWHQQDQLSKLSPGKFSETIQSYPSLPLEVLGVISINEDFSKNINHYLSEWSKIKIHTTGDDLKELGIPPGPLYKQILKKIKMARIDGDIKTKKAEKRMLRDILENIQ